MERKIKVGILGATGMVGQNYIRLLADHPWFEISYLAASPRSAGKSYSEAVKGRWQMRTEIPGKVQGMIVDDANDIKKAAGKCELVFSAIDLDKAATAQMEIDYAKAGFPVVSNNSAHRSTPDVPMLIPEVNYSHLEVIADQKKHYGFDKGLIVVKPNCSIQAFMIAVDALQKAGHKVEKLITMNLQALSGAGYPGHSALDMIDNVMHLPGEEEKSAQEPLKIFGHVENGKIVERDDFTVSAHCMRVPVIDGHLSNVSVGFAGKAPSGEEIISIWKNYESEPQKLNLPSAPKPCIIYREEENRPQHSRDRDSGNGMAVTTGRLRPCNLFDYRFSALAHNTVRGAAGGSILIAELLVAKGFVK